MSAKRCSSLKESIFLILGESFLLFISCFLLFAKINYLDNSVYKSSHTQKKPKMTQEEAISLSVDNKVSSETSHVAEPAPVNKEIKLYV